MARLFNYSTKQWEDHPDDDSVNAKIASGGYGLEAGLKIPVVNPNSGNVFEIPTESAAEAFRTGIRLATPQDLAAKADIETQRVKEEALNAPVQAGLLGAARGATFGLSDVAARAVGGPEAAETLKSVKEANPKSSLAGEVIGSVLAPIPGAVEKTIATSAKGLKTGIEAATGLTKAGRIAAKYGSKVLGSSAESALYGLGSGISEAALGDPQDIAEHLVHGAATGAVFGGLLGGAFEGAKDVVPLFKEIGKSAYSAAESSFPKTTELATDIAAKLASVPMAARDKMIDLYANRVARKHGDEVADSVRDLLRTPEQTAEALAQRPLAGTLEKEAGSLQAQAESELRQTESAIRGTAERTPGVIAREDIAATKGLQQDIAAEIKDITARQKQGYDNFYKTLDQHYGAIPGQEFSKISNEIEPLLAKLEKSNDAVSRVNADSIRERIAMLGDTPSIADETRALIDLKKELGKLTQKAKDAPIADRKIIHSLYDNIKTKLDDYPVDEIKSELGELNRIETARHALVKNLGAKNVDSLPKNLASITLNPGQRDAFNTIVDNIGDFAPTLKQLQSKVNDVAARRDLLNTFRDTLDQKKSAALGGRMSINDVVDVLNMFGRVKGDTEKFVERAKDLQKLIAATPDMALADKVLAYKKALGQPVDAELQKSLDKVRGLDQKIKNLDRLADVQVPQRAGLINIPNALAAMLAGPKGVAAVETVRTIGRSTTDPFRTVKNLVAIERAANKGAQAAQNSIAAVGKALTSDTARKVGVSYKVYGEPLNETRANLSKQREILTRMADKPQAAQYLMNRVPPIVGAPLVQSAIMDQMMRTADFLAAKLPVDPFAGKYMIGTPTNYIPSDTELAKYNRYLNAAQHPEMAIQSISRLSATPEEVETLKTLYPKTFERLQTEVVNAITKSGVSLSYPQRLTASQVLGTPMDATMDPEYIKGIQARYSQQMPKDQGGRPEGTAPMKSIKIDIKPLETVQTAAQRVTNK